MIVTTALIIIRIMGTKKRSFYSIVTKENNKTTNNDTFENNK